MASSNSCSTMSVEGSEEVEDIYEEAEINNLAIDLINSGMNVKEWKPVRDLMTAQQDLQPHIQSMNDPLVNAVNDDITMFFSTTCNSVEICKKMQNTAERLRDIELPPEAVAIINENGRSMCRIAVDNIQGSVNCIQRNRTILATTVEKDKRKKKQRADIEKILKKAALVGLGVIAAGGLISSGIGMVAAVTAATQMTTAQSATAVAVGITGSLAIGAAKDKKR